MRAWRLLARAGGLTALVVGLLTATVASAQAPTRAPDQAGAPASTGVVEYVALGDSFTAGPFIPRTLAAFGCFRSTRNYPSLVADALDVPTLVDVSCVGADTTDMHRSQPTPFMAMSAQLEALSRSTDLVTLGIGGNDFGLFGRLVGECTSLRATDPRGRPCADRYRRDDGNVLLRQAGRVQERVSGVLAEIRRRAPSARVVVVGYPRIAPVRGTCPAELPLADGDYRFANAVERRLNASLRSAARASGAAYVDTYRASRGHDVCAGSRAWVNGQVTDTERAQRYHPFHRYMVAVARRVTARVLR